MTGARRVGQQATQGLGLVPVGAEQVGTEVADDVVLAVTRDQLDDAEGEPDRDLGCSVDRMTRASWAGRRHRWPGG